MHEFLEIYDLILSVCLVTLLMTSLPQLLSWMTSLWKRTNRFIMVKLSKIFCQSSPFRPSRHILRALSGLASGSSGTLYEVGPLSIPLYSSFLNLLKLVFLTYPTELTLFTSDGLASSKLSFFFLMSVLGLRGSGGADIWLFMFS